MEQRPRILIVEPNKRYMGVLARRVAAAGYRVVAADCGRTGFGELHRQPVDLVLAELDMPRMSGADLARLIRGEVQWRDVPIVLITGKSNPHGAVRAYEAGADDVILKPFHFEVLFARIERRLARANAFRALRDDNAALDARIVERSIQMGELRDRLAASEAERVALRQLVRATARP